MRWIGAAFLLLMPLGANAADASAGANEFHKFRCDSCHSVYGAKVTAPIPLRDVSREKPDVVAAMILVRSHATTRSKFDELVMANTASTLSAKELSDIVAYLRRPR